MDREIFIGKLFENCDGHIDLRAILQSEPVHQAFCEWSDSDCIEKFCQENQKKNLFFGVATRNGLGGKKNNIIHIPAVWCDVDFKDTPRTQLKENWKKFPYNASATVKSGGGVHFYYFLKEPVGQEEMLKVEDINRRIAQSLGGDFNSIDASRILRIPDTINYKYPAPVQITQLNDFYYNLDDFLDILPEVELKKEGIEAKSTSSNESKKIMKCDFIKFCKSHPDQVPEPLWYALISNLISVRPGGVALCHTLSKGHSKYTHKETDQKILHALNSSRPLSCAYIRENGFNCEKSCHVMSPAGLLFDDSYYDEGDRVNVEPQIKVSFR